MSTESSRFTIGCSLEIKTSKTLQSNHLKTYSSCMIGSSTPWWSRSMQCSFKLSWWFTRAFSHMKANFYMISVNMLKLISAKINMCKLSSKELVLKVMCQQDRHLKESSFWLNTKYCLICLSKMMYVIIWYSLLFIDFVLIRTWKIGSPFLQFHHWEVFKWIHIGSRVLIELTVWEHLNSEACW